MTATKMTTMTLSKKRRRTGAELIEHAHGLVRCVVHSYTVNLPARPWFKSPSWQVVNIAEQMVRARPEKEAARVWASTPEVFLHQREPFILQPFGTIDPQLDVVRLATGFEEDAHVRRVVRRMGIVARQLPFIAAAADEHLKTDARLSPMHLVRYEVRHAGRTWCRYRDPKCHSCSMQRACMTYRTKEID